MKSSDMDWMEGRPRLRLVLPFSWLSDPGSGWAGRLLPEIGGGFEAAICWFFGDAGFVLFFVFFLLFFFV